MIFYLENATWDNGCTLLIPGSHLLQGHPDDLFDHEQTLIAPGLMEQTVGIPMPPGGMIAIDSTLIHGPAANRTNETRMSMTIGYHSVDELCEQENPRRILVRGRRIYMGSDS